MKHELDVVEGYVPEVQFVEPDGTTRVVVLEEGPTSIGRHPGNTVVVDDPTISSTHLVLHRQGAQIRVCDESTYGTRVQGARLIPEQPIKVHDGQTITFGGDDQGRYRLIVRDPLERPPTEPPRDAVKKVQLPAQLRVVAEALVHQYVERVSAAPHPASVEEMADRLDVHEATVRRRLTDLETSLKTDSTLHGSRRLAALAERILATDAHSP
jgi:hypothetical protein